jgi:hypothetical protein
MAISTMTTIMTISSSGVVPLPAQSVVPAGR